MQLRTTPTLDARYWVAILIASIVGANTGDLFAHDFGLGHVGGLLPLAVVFVAIRAAERAMRISSEAFYWLIILTLRTAATNLGDLATHDFKLAYPLVIAALAVLLALVWFADHARTADTSAAETQKLGGVDLMYWLAMLIAGTLGTAAGDFIADMIGLTNACIVTTAALIAIVMARLAAGRADRGSYWVAIVAVRTAGTNLGDYCAGRHGLNIGLPADTALFGVLLIGLLVMWPSRAALRPQRT